MTIMYPDYERSILNISQSILKCYGLATKYSSIKEIDDILATNPKHVMFILLDGLGINILKQNLPATSSLRRHRVATLTSVFPPTTAAATTSFLSGSLPRTSGYISWMQYDKQNDVHTVMFRNEDYYDPEHKVLATNFPGLFAYQNIFSKVRDARPDVDVEELWPDFRFDGYLSFQDQVDRLIEISKTSGKTLNYTYWVQPDAIIHRDGENGVETQAVIEGLDQQFYRLIKNVGPDTAIFLFADHGLVNVKPLDFVETPEFQDLLRMQPSLEGRSCTFFLKEGKDAAFLEYYHKNLSKHFLLVPGKEYFSSKLFGVGEDHPLLPTFIGDYVLISTDKYYIRLIKGKEHLAHHAGLTNGEMQIPLIVFQSSKD